MATNSTNELMRTAVTIYYGTAGSGATTPIGFIPETENAVVAWDLLSEEFRVQGADFPVAIMSRAKGLKLSFPISQFGDIDITELGYALTNAAGVLTLGDPSLSLQVAQISLRVLGQDVQGNNFDIVVPYASLTTPGTFPMGQSALSMQTLEFTALDGDAAVTLPTITYDGAGTTLTLDTLGDLDIADSSLGIFKVAGFGGAADAWVTHSSLVEGDDNTIFRFYGASASYAITVTDDNDVLDLMGTSANFTLGGSAAALNSFVDLKYDHATVSLIAIRQFDGTV